MWMQDDLVPGFFFLSITRGSGRWLGGAWVCTLMYPTSFGDYPSLSSLESLLADASLGETCLISACGLGNHLSRTVR